MRVFVTGGPGLVGSHTAAHLIERGHQVVALRRQSSDTRYLDEIGCSFAEGDVRHGPESLTPLMTGCTHVLHAAALVYTGGSWPRIRAVNVEGTRNVLEAAVRAGVEHAVHVSSVAVYGSSSGPLDEDSPVDSDLLPGDLYARSKRGGEIEARRVEGEEGLPVTVLRPAAVYGERDRLMVPRIARMVRRPVAFLLGPGDNTIPTVYAGNVAVATVLALEAGKGGATYDVALDHPLTQRALLEGLARGMGRAPRLVRLPAPLVRTVADVLGRLGVPAPGAAHLPIGRVVRLALGENPFTSARIRRELGWDPPYRHQDALLRTGRWTADHGSVPAA